MKKQLSKLHSSEYKLLHKGFMEWLSLLGYSPLAIPGLGLGIENFLLYQQQHNKHSLQQLYAMDAVSYIEHLQVQIGERTHKPFSAAYLNKQIQSLKLFSRYIRQTGQSTVAFTIQRHPQLRSKPVWLTQQEVQQLYDVIKDNLLGIRDRAMLAVYYGCGLRLNEGIHLEINDINPTTKVLHVRKGKHYKERFVPVAEKNFEAIKLYIDYARPQFLQEEQTERLFIRAQNGRPVDKQSLYIRIKQLVKKAGIQNKVSTHTLRHSIATHLLQSGMKLERIQQFLGHSSLDSTQIYTHIINQTS